MDVDPPSAMTRFGMFFLAGGVALIFAFWGVLKWLDQPAKHPPPARSKEMPTVTPAAPAASKPSYTAFQDS